MQPDLRELLTEHPELLWAFTQERADTFYIRNLNIPSNVGGGGGGGELIFKL